MWYAHSPLPCVTRSCRYGTVPVAHKTGGLRDTVLDFDPWKQSGTGWTYTSCDAQVGRVRVRRMWARVSLLPGREAIRPVSGTRGRGEALEGK